MEIPDNVRMPCSPPAVKVGVVMIEDHALLAQVLGTWLAGLPEFDLLGRAADAETGFKLCLEVKPDLALLDIELPGMDGLALAKALRFRLPKTRLIALTAQIDPHTIWRAVRIGLHGFVEKSQPLDKLLETMRSVSQGKTCFSPVFLQVQSEWLSSPDAFQKILSLREQEILRRVAVGESDEEIGRALGIALATVHAHRRNIRFKLSLHNDRDMVAYARRWGLDKMQPIGGDLNTAEPDGPGSDPDVPPPPPEEPA